MSFMQKFTDHPREAPPPLCRRLLQSFLDNFEFTAKPPSEHSELSSQEEEPARPKKRD